MRPDFAVRYGPWALVAGGSEGIGAAFARSLAAAGLSLVLAARRREPLDALAGELRAAYGVTVRTVPVDLASPELLGELAASTDDVEIGLVVYSAGAILDAGLFLRRPLDEALQLVDRNCRGVVSVAHHFGGSMAERSHGGLVLMASMSAGAGSGYTALYNATKAFDLVLAEGLWMELAPSGVDVLAVPAGLTDTPSMRRSGILGTDSGFVAMEAAEVAREALDALGETGPLFVPGRANREGAAFLWPVDRHQLIRAMTDGAAALYGLPTLPDPQTASPAPASAPGPGAGPGTSASGAAG